MDGSRGVCADTSSLTLPGSSSYVEEESGSSGPGLSRKATCPVPRQHSQIILSDLQLLASACHFPGIPCNSDSQLRAMSPP